MRGCPLELYTSLLYAYCVNLAIGKILTWSKNNLWLAANINYYYYEIPAKPVTLYVYQRNILLFLSTYVTCCLGNKLIFCMY